MFKAVYRTTIAPRLFFFLSDHASFLSFKTQNKMSALDYANAALMPKMKAWLMVRFMCLPVGVVVVSKF